MKNIGAWRGGTPLEVTQIASSERGWPVAPHDSEMDIVDFLEQCETPSNVWRDHLYSISKLRLMRSGLTNQRQIIAHPRRLNVLETKEDRKRERAAIARENKRRRDKARKRDYVQEKKNALANKMKKALANKEKE